MFPCLSIWSKNVTFVCLRDSRIPYRHKHISLIWILLLPIIGVAMFICTLVMYMMTLKRAYWTVWEGLKQWLSRSVANGNLVFHWICVCLSSYSNTKRV